MNQQVIYAVLLAFGVFFIGYFVGKYLGNGKAKAGTIRIEPTEDGERESFGFIFDIDFEDLKAKKQVVFLVENRSKNSQSV